MMDLITIEKNVRGHKVSVDSGALYDVDANGVIRNVADADADELLCIPSWKLYVPGAPPPVATRVPVKSGITLIGPDGQPLKRELPPPPPAPVTEPGKVGVQNPPITNVVGLDGGALPEPTVAPEGQPSTETVPSGQEMYGQWPIPEKGADWPDPVVEMPIEYLKLMADAYGVRYAPNIGEAAKLAFVERIEKAMYEPASAG